MRSFKIIAAVVTLSVVASVSTYAIRDKVVDSDRYMVPSLAFDNIGGLVIGGTSLVGHNGVVEYRKGPTRKGGTVILLTNSDVDCVQTSKIGNLIAIGSDSVDPQGELYNCSISIVNASSTLFKTQLPGVPLLSLRFSTDGQNLGITAGNDISIWNLRNNKISSMTTKLGRTAYGLAWFRHSSKYVFIDGDIAGKTGEIGIAKRSSKSPNAELELTHVAPTALDLSPDDTLVAVGFANGIVDVRRSNSFKLVTSYRCGAREIHSLRFSPDGTHILACGFQAATLFDVKARRPLWQNNYPDWVHTGAFSPDGHYLAMGLSTPDSTGDLVEVYSLSTASKAPKLVRLVH